MISPDVAERGLAISRIYTERAGLLPEPGGRVGGWLYGWVANLAYGPDGVDVRCLGLDVAEQYAVTAIDEALREQELTSYVPGYQRAIRGAAELLRGTRDVCEQLILDRGEADA